MLCRMSLSLSLANVIGTDWDYGYLGSIPNLHTLTYSYILFSVYPICGHMISAWLIIGEVNLEHLIKVVFMANVLIDLYLGLFENYILKLKSSLKAGTIWGYYSFGFKKEMKRDTQVFSAFSFWGEKTCVF